MKNTFNENIAEHSQHTALIAHCLALIEKRIYLREINADRVGMLALFHESGEVLTGDLPTPIKYFSLDIQKAYKDVENFALEKLITLLPDELKGDLDGFVIPDKSSYEYKLVKAADKIDAYIKCLQELKTQNREFNSALRSLKESVEKLKKDIPSVEYFIDNFIEAYSKTLDEL